MSSEKTKASEEQIIYANILNYGMMIGFVILTITFLLYVFGAFNNFVPIDKLPNYWKLKVGDYLYVMSQIEQGKDAEAVALIEKCKAEGGKAEECKEIYEKGHKMAGWSWLKNISKGDYMNFVGIAILAGLTIACYAAIIPALFRKKDTAYLLIAIAEVLVLTLAASGILKGGGH
ncbi:MAG: hypothetical protein OEW15_12715 [Nitrospirota bacterium]|nr:hypothetical protein [Nitrospirota bacterium]